MATTLQSTSLGVTRNSEVIASWCTSKAKRAFDIACGGMLLLASLPVMAFAAALIKLTSPGPVLFRQKRVGQGGVEITLLKFRTMIHAQSNSGPGVTRTGDPRITPVGRILRNLKIDELPQFINVMRGEMTLVGPRPDLAKYLNKISDAQRPFFRLKPGITSPATLTFRDEERLLSRIPEHEIENVYCTALLPHKIHLELEYAAQATFASDTRVLFQTASALLWPDPHKRKNTNPNGQQQNECQASGEPHDATALPLRSR